MSKAIVHAAALLCGLVAATPPSRATDATTRQFEQVFESRVRPLFAEKCHRCHGGTVAEAGLRLDTRAALLAGGDSGPAVVPGDAAHSLLVAVVRRIGDVAMPPDAALAREEVATIEAWVAAGAPWPGAGGDDDPRAAVTRAADMDQRLADARERHWAFQPPKRHPAPPLPASFAREFAGAWSEAPIDRFVAAALGAAGVQPSPEAEPRDLYRRLAFDLTGLPPTADAADAFCAAAAAGADAADAAFRAAVERMLESREHAEHWARRWLDLARYADTMGYAIGGQDGRYPFAWTYRDWVVESLHRDLPYDRFITLQIAADRVDPPAPRSDLAALGFLTVGRTFIGNPHDIIDDRIDLVTRGLMGLTVACARCHDHKYEPVAAADYYGLYGIFASSRVPDELPVIGDPPAGPEAEAFAHTLAELEAAIARHQTAVHERASREAVIHAATYFREVARPSPRGADKRPPRLEDGYEIEQLLLDRLDRLLAPATREDPVFGPWAAVRGQSDADLALTLAALVDGWGIWPDPRRVNGLVFLEIVSSRPQTLPELAEVYGRLVARVAPPLAGGFPPSLSDAADVVALRTALGVEGSPLIVPAAEALRVAKREEQLERNRLEKAVTRHQAESPGGPPRAMVLVDAAKPVDGQVFLRGNPGNRGARVPRRLPKILGGASVDRGSSGRLDLARAIVAADNPLSARVVVNWAWTHHFGHGLISTPGDLGLRGEPPSHPELLDDLARRFVEEGGWSLRWLHREIVSSRTWRQSSRPRPDLVDRDPDNRLLARAQRRRLDWEPLRDGMLTAAGTLDPRRGGGPGMDPLGERSMGVRSLYTRLDRQDVPGMLRVFDVANPDTAVHVRSRTTVPQQSLALFNAPLVVASAQAAAARVQGLPPADDHGRVVALWRAVLARSPEPDELAAATVWLAEESRRDAATRERPGVEPCERLAQALLATAEFQFLD